MMPGEEPPSIKLQHQCFECGYAGEVDCTNRKVTCPTCETSNDFWLDGEEPPENHC